MLDVMPDYGQPLRFGTFITPTNAPPHRPVELAVAAEEFGFDFATFQDHPYQPGFADTWTLLSWVAARTERIGLAGNVLNLPLRQPAVLARSLATLDLLSGGRVALGLGAGGFWDAIAAMGGPRRTGGEAVSALDEALEIIRGIWDAAEPRSLKVDGDFYRVRGAKRGPAPTHTIPIWLGAYKPRMLRLVGRAADGWLPSLSYLKEGDLDRGNQIIDEAARAVGRDPVEITRLLNVPATLGPDELVALATGSGVSIFIVTADDESTMARVAGDVIPEVRERVAEARAAGGTRVVGRVRSTAARARRLPGIAYDDLPASLVSGAVEPGDARYARYTSGYLRGGAPGLVLRAGSAAEVADAVGFAGRHRDLPLGIFSAGHGISGRSLNRGGLVIDVGGMNRIQVVDADAGVVRIGPGARWVDVARALSPHGLVLTSGDYGGVGVGGLATAGGIGYFARQYGLTIDHLRAAEVVLADGRVVRTDAATEPDLFWAVRGAGANVGVVTDFEFVARPAGEVAFAQLVFDASDTAGFLQAWGEAIEAADRRVSGEVVLGGARSGMRPAHVMLVINSDDRDTILADLNPIAQIAPLLDQSVAIARYDAVLAAFTSDAPQQGRGEPTSHSGLLAHLTDGFARDAAALLDAGASHFFQIRAVGGAVNDVAAGDTAYAWRSANFSVAAMGSPRSGLDEWWPRLEAHFEGMYLSFETATGPDVVAKAFPPEHLARLRDIKRRYDPDGLFRDNFFVAPA